MSGQLLSMEVNDIHRNTDLPSPGEHEVIALAEGAPPGVISVEADGR